MGNVTKTTSRRSTKAPEKATEDLPVEIASGVAEPVADKPSVRRLTTLGWAWMNHANYKKGTNVKGETISRLYFTMKYRDPQIEELQIVEVHVFGTQADYLYENLGHNTQIVARGRFDTKERKDQPGVFEPIFIPNDAWGISLPIPKKAK